MTKPLQHIPLLALTLLAVNAALASNVSFLKNAPIAHFDAADMELLTAAADEVLDEDGVHVKREWANPKTGNSGTVETLSQFTNASGAACKRLRIVTQAKQKTKSAVYDACLQDGAWLLGPSQKPKK